MATFKFGRRKSSVFRSGGKLFQQHQQHPHQPHGDFRPLFTAMDRDCNGYIDKVVVVYVFVTVVVAISVVVVFVVIGEVRKSKQDWRNLKII